MIDGRAFGGGRLARGAVGSALVAVALGVARSPSGWTAPRVAVVGSLLLLALAVFSPVRFDWAGRTIAAAVFLAYGAWVVDAVRARGGGVLAGAHPPFAALLGLLVVGIPALAWAFRRRGAAPLPLAADDPLLAAAARRARQTLPELRRLRVEAAGAAAVRWPLETDAGEIEHVWGEVLALHLDEVVVRLLSRPVTQRARLPATHTVPLSAVEDWQVTLPDGAVRGSFSTIAMIAACRRDGRPVPRALRTARLLDAEEPPSAIAGGAAS